MAETKATDASPLLSAELNKVRFLTTLAKLISEGALLSECSLDASLQIVVPHLINLADKYTPEESFAAQHVLKALEPYTIQNGGCLNVREVQFTKNRSNIIIEYPSLDAKDSKEKDKAAATKKSLTFAGAHLDVVYCDRDGWEKDPFKLTVEGDKLFGRGTTDCLGHVALLTEVFISLASLKPKLGFSVFGVIVADAEGDDKVLLLCVSLHYPVPKGLLSNGDLDEMKAGPMFWLDAADTQPNTASGGCVQWRLTAIGKAGHSGSVARAQLAIAVLALIRLPHKAVNAIELANDCLLEIQRRMMTNDFPPHEREKDFNFPCPSSLKPTNIAVPAGPATHIRAECVIEGDIRLTPFYRIADAKKAMQAHVDHLNATHFRGLRKRYMRGPTSQYDGGQLHLEWLSEGRDGFACDLKSAGHRVHAEATLKYAGKLKPLADTGFLPFVGLLHSSGFDLHVCGFGVEAAYHADNEFARLQDFVAGFRILMYIINAWGSSASSSGSSGRSANES